LEVSSIESIRRFMKDETGVSAAEYGIILGSIAALLITGLLAFYTNLAGVFQSWADWFVGKGAPK